MPYKKKAEDSIKNDQAFMTSKHWGRKTRNPEPHEKKAMLEHLESA